MQGDAMRKTVFVFLVLFISLNVFAQNSAPAFDRPNSIVLDAKSDGGAYNNFTKVINNTRYQQQLSFNVFAYDEDNSTWLLIGTASLKKAPDTDTISSPLTGRLRKFRWFAIQSLDGVQFDAQLVTSWLNVNITVF